MSESAKKPITEAQAAARRNNGKHHSTGPRTAEGKKASSRNSRTHGLWAKSDPVIDSGLLAENPDQFEELRLALHGEFSMTSPLMAEVIDELAGVLWRLRRVGAIEALAVQQDTFPDRWADRTREEIEETLMAERYLREHGIDLPVHDFISVASGVQRWAGWEFGEGFNVDDPAPASAAEREDLIEKLLANRWNTWEQAADHALEVARNLEERDEEERRLKSIERARVLMHGDLLGKLNRPESHLARERDRLIALLRKEEARLAKGYEEGE